MAKRKVLNYKSSADREAINALKDETYSNFGDSMRGVYKTSSNLMSMARKERVSSLVNDGRIGGDSYQNISKNIAGEFASGGITAFKDKGGKSWDIDTYANMLARTKLNEASRLGLMNQLQQNGFDLVQVSTHFGACPLCEPWEGSILSISGDTDRLYGVKIDTVDTAKDEGLFHPNCQHRLVPFHPRFAANSYAWSIRNQEYVYSMFAQTNMSWRTKWQLFINWVKFNEAGFANIADLKRNYVPRREGESHGDYAKRVQAESTNPVKVLLPKMETAINTKNFTDFKNIVNKWKAIGTPEALQYAKQHEKMAAWLFPNQKL